MAVATIKGKKIRRCLVTIPLLYLKTYSKDELITLIIKNEKLKTGESMSIDLERIIIPNQKILLNGANYLLCTKGNTINLKPISPIFFSEEVVLYLKKAIKYKDELINSTNDLTSMTIKEKKQEYTISKEKNLYIFNEIILLASKKKYEQCSMISQLTEFDKESFTNKSMHEQIELLISMVALFTRKSRTLSTKFTKNSFLKTKNFIDEENVILIYDSITGLESFKKAL